MHCYFIYLYVRLFDLLIWRASLLYVFVSEILLDNRKQKRMYIISIKKMYKYPFEWFKDNENHDPRQNGQKSIYFEVSSKMFLCFLMCHFTTFFCGFYFLYLFLKNSIFISFLIHLSLFILLAIHSNISFSALYFLI